MNKMIVGIDIDNVVSDFSKLFISEFNKRTGKDLKREDLITWNFKDAINDIFFDIDGSIANEIISEPSFFRRLELKEGALEGIKLLAEDGRFEIRFVTAIPDSMTYHRDIWLIENFFEFRFAVAYESKKSKVKMDYLIDDGIHNLDDLSSIIGKEKCLCIKEPYNSHTDYKLFDTLEQAVKFVIEKESIPQHI